MAQNHKISQQLADQLRNNHKNANPGTIESFRYDIDQVKELVNQEGAEFLKVAYGIDDKNEACIVLSTINNNKEEQNLILELGWPCPPYCD